MALQKVEEAEDLPFAEVGVEAVVLPFAEEAVRVP